MVIFLFGGVGKDRTIARHFNTRAGIPIRSLQSRLFSCS